jgi:shikimate kinase
VALTGFMAAGKSTVGRALAEVLGWRFVDLDAEIENHMRQTIPAIFAEQGEARFREIETEALRAVMDSVESPAVIALGGGTFTRSDNADLLRAAGVHVVFLDVAVDELLDRCRAANSQGRPLAQDEQVLRELHAQRLPLYRRADFVVSGDGKSAEEVARVIAELVKEPA